MRGLSPSPFKVGGLKPPCSPYFPAYVATIEIDLVLNMNP